MESTVVYLGSGSPRRKELITTIFPEFQVIKAPGEIGYDSSVYPCPRDFCLANAKDKALQILSLKTLGSEDLLLTCDTVVHFEGLVLGKPESAEENRMMLEQLSGRAHDVTSCVYLCRGSGQELTTLKETTQVKFFPLDKDLITQYVRSNEGFDKAGGYGIQGLGRMLVESIQGCFYNVMGLPVPRLYQQIKPLGLASQLHWT